MSLDPALRSRIESLLQANRVVLFMKGQPGAPQCGFSAKASGVLEDLGVDYAHVNVLADAEIRKPISEWRQLGVNNIPAADDQARAVLLLPAGHRGPAFLVLDNFRAILKYNNSTAYGLAIGLLSDTLNGHPGVQAAWPRSDRQLGRSERIELQELLTSKGYTPGAADGIIGANTRKAVRAFQQSLGQPADGYPSHELLQQLR